MTEQAVKQTGGTPKALQYLSSAGKQTIVDLIAACEKGAQWPQQASHLINYLIPKEDGGERPLALLATLVRVWEALRLPELAQAPTNTWCNMPVSASTTAWGSLRVPC